MSTSGDIYFKLPTLLFSGQVPLLDPKMPKSTILRSILRNYLELSLVEIGEELGMSARRIFWNFISLWIIFIE